MNNNENSAFAAWKETAQALFRAPHSLAFCPKCSSRALSAEWHLVSVLAREVSVDFSCSNCEVKHRQRMALPPNVPGCFPLARMGMAMQALQAQLPAIAGRLQKYGNSMPIAAFTISPLWQKARWIATTYQWHPQSEGPPCMGIVFKDSQVGKQLFQGLKTAYNQTDRFEEMHISIIEGSPPGQKFGYSVHICPDPEALAMHATGDDVVLNQNLIPFLGKWNRAYPIPGSPPVPLLTRFKEEFAKHGQFMLAPVVRREDGQDYFDPHLGIIKHTIQFRQLSDITPEGDIDALALVMPALITPDPPTPFIGGRWALP